MSSRLRIAAMPALLTRMSIAPKRCSMSWTMLCTALRSETSAPKAAARPPLLRMARNGEWEVLGRRNLHASHRLFGNELGSDLGHHEFQETLYYARTHPVWMRLSDL